MDNSREQLNFSTDSNDIVIWKTGFNFFLRQKIHPNGQTEQTDTVYQKNTTKAIGHNRKRQGIY